VIDEKKFFTGLGSRIRNARKARGYSQEDMISFGFSARHWQQVEKGRPITLRTLLRICGALHISVATLVKGLDRGIYV
jgi:transcriptional regulator with XRE-family HTH domain